MNQSIPAVLVQIIGALIVAFVLMGTDAHAKPTYVAATIARPDAPAKSLGANVVVKEVAAISGETKLLSFFDKDTGMLCYGYSDYSSAPSCLKTAEPQLPVASLEPGVTIALAKVSFTTNLVRVFDRDTGVLCYGYDNFRSSPSCHPYAPPRTAP